MAEDEFIVLMFGFFQRNPGASGFARTNYLRKLYARARLGLRSIAGVEANYDSRSFQLVRSAHSRARRRELEHSGTVGMFTIAWVQYSGLHAYIIEHVCAVQVGQMDGKIRHHPKGDWVCL